MGNSPPQALFEGGQEEKQLGEHLTVLASSSGADMLKACAAVAGTALLALGAWYLLSHLSSGDAPDGTDEEIKGKRMRTDGRVKSDCSGLYLQLERFHMSSSKLCTSDTYLRSDQNVIKILSYNVWSGDVKLRERMKAIGHLIQEHSPHLICFQEVTPEIYKIFENSNWWEAYCCSLSPEMASRRKYFCMQLSKLPAEFRREHLIISNMERELCIAKLDVCMGRKQLVFAACHLVSPNPDRQHPDRMYSAERVQQAKKAIKHLKHYSNVVFGGDMNWDEEVDGSFPLPHGWVDAWEEKRPGEDGWTFDTKANPMLSRKPPLRKRLDRFLCTLEDFSISSIEIIGTEAIPGVSYWKEWNKNKVGKKVRKTPKPVLPSDHYGLLLTIYSL